MSVAVEQLLQQNSARLWRARETGSSAAAVAPAGLPTGYAALDRCLPGMGWPRQGLIEILSDQRGIGELRLLLPALAALCRDEGAADEGYPPPRPDHAGSAMPSHDRGSVLGWSNPRDPHALRRLQLAAEASRSLAVLYRPLQAGLTHSPAVLRLALLGGGTAGLQVRIVKSRGGRPATVNLGH